ncbi:nucleotidyltransferase domain-containing protein [Stenotrophomonas sp. Ker107b]
MDSSAPKSRLEVLLKDIDLPEGAYKRAEGRYHDLASWISRDGSTLASYDAHIFVQGSFALGTAIRPVNPEEEYDLDFSCKLRKGISRESHSQADLKEMIRFELEGYRKSRGIQSQLESKHRCWRLSYQDELAFHMDVVPGLRADDKRRSVLTERMVHAGVNRSLAEEVARRALWITDDQRDNFKELTEDWPSSNPGGYQKWFTSRMEPTGFRALAEARVDPVPVYRARQPLQQTVQLLKRHRDVMFAEQLDLKPASILITTIAGLACVPGESLDATLGRALHGLKEVRDRQATQILNPINPHENFADRWTGPNCPLRRNFYQWIDSALVAFAAWRTINVPQRLIEVAKDDFEVSLGADAARALSGGVTLAPTARQVAIDAPPAPWRG